MRDSEALDRSSFVPLYYQLQELIKEQIESGGWKPGDRLPSEPELARRYAVSRVVVRQALAILQDDGQIVRVQGRGTFVAEPKLDARAGGLARLLADAPPARCDDRGARGGHPAGRAVDPQRARGRRPRARPPADHRAVRPRGSRWRSRTRSSAPRTCDGSRTPCGSAALSPGELVLADHGIELAGSSLSIETSQCGQFEADCFGIPHRSAVFLVLSTELRRDGAGVVPFEVARVEYRGDLLQLRLEVSGEAPGAIEAVWALTDEADGRLAERARVSAA